MSRRAQKVELVDHLRTPQVGHKYVSAMPAALMLKWEMSELEALHRQYHHGIKVDIDVTEAGNN